MDDTRQLLTTFYERRIERQQQYIAEYERRIRDYPSGKRIWQIEIACCEDRILSYQRELDRLQACTERSEHMDAPGLPR